MNSSNALARLFAALTLFACSFANAIVFSVGPQISTVPSYISSGALGANQFFVPINVSGAVQLQDWQFDFSFDPTVVTQIEPFFTPYSFGLYAARFNPTDANSLSSPTSAGFSFSAGLIEQIAGFSQGASGNGPLVFLAFEYRQPGSDPGFEISNVIAAQPVPEPSTWALFAVGLIGFALHRKVASANTHRTLPIGSQTHATGNGIGGI